MIDELSLPLVMICWCIPYDPDNRWRFEGARLPDDEACLGERPTKLIGRKVEGCLCNMQ